MFWFFTTLGEKPKKRLKDLVNPSCDSKLYWSATSKTLLLFCKEEKAYLSKYLATIITDQDLEYSLEDFEYDKLFSKEVYDVFKRYQFNILLKKTELFVENVNAIKHEVNITTIDKENQLDDLIVEINQIDEFALYLHSIFIQIKNTK